MNAILKPPHQPTPITDAERARRQTAVSFGRGSVRFEGFVLSAQVEELNRQFVDGALTMDELIAGIKASAPQQPSSTT